MFWNGYNEFLCIFDSHIVFGSGIFSNCILIFIKNCKKVIPNEFGKKKHPLFFLNCFRSQNDAKTSRQITPKNHKIELSSPEADNVILS